MTNAFETFADSMRSPRARAYEERKAAQRTVDTPEQRAEKLRGRKAEANAAGRREIERQELARGYRKWKAQQLRDLLAGTHGRNIVELRKFMRRLTIADAPALLALIPSLTWLFEITPERRFLVRSMIAAQIGRIRLRAGFHVFDDSLEFFGEAPDASTTILAMLA